MIISTINETALTSAATAVVGPEATNAIIAMYFVIDRAMKDGYELGKMDSDERLEKCVSNAFDNGYNEGFDAGVVSTVNDQDNAYIQGVSDARARPKVADDKVCDIINGMVQEAVNGEYDPSNVQDSGDEDDGYTYSDYGPEDDTSYYTRTSEF